MSVRYDAAVEFTAGQDTMFTVNGVTFGIKVTDTTDVDVVSLFEKSGAQWILQEHLCDWDWEEEMQQVGNIEAWFKAVVIPRLNAWIAKRFSRPMTLAEQLDLFMRNKLALNNDTPPVAFLK